MIERFQGDNGKRRLVEAIKDQVMVHGKDEVAVELAEVAELIELKEGDELINQGDDDEDLYLVLSGRVVVVVNGREVAIRESRLHVGEMALIDPKAQRCASVIAMETTVVAKISEPDFSRIAEKFTYLWRRIAVELCDRLRERNLLVKSPNPRPVLFIGCSTESLPIAKAIQTGLQHSNVLVKVWTDDVFRASHYPMEDLEREVTSSDFAALVIGPDDKVVSRKEESDAPRDNVILELGLFMGQLWRQRTFMVKPRGIDLKIPSDLAGLNPIEFRPPTSDDEVAAELAPVCTELDRIIKEHGPR